MAPLPARLLKAARSVPALLLALDLEGRGFRLSLEDEGNQFQIEPRATLTAEDVAGIRRWQHHLGAIVSYNADAHGALQ